VVRADPFRQTEEIVLDEIVIRAIVAVVGAGAVAALAWFRGWGRRTLRASLSAAGAAWNRREARARATRQEREIREAAAAGENIVVSVTGHNPVKVREAGADPGVLYFFRDVQTYKREVGSRRAPHLRSTCCGRPPKVGTRRKVSVPTRA